MTLTPLVVRAPTISPPIPVSSLVSARKTPWMGLMKQRRRRRGSEDEDEAAKTKMKQQRRRRSSGTRGSAMTPAVQLYAEAPHPPCSYTRYASLVSAGTRRRPCMLPATAETVPTQAETVPAQAGCVSTAAVYGPGAMRPSTSRSRRVTPSASSVQPPVHAATPTGCM
jgi:hypothetical protein